MTRAHAHAHAQSQLANDLGSKSSIHVDIEMKMKIPDIQCACTCSGSQREPAHAGQSQPSRPLQTNPSLTASTAHKKIKTTLDGPSLFLALISLLMVYGCMGSWAMVLRPAVQTALFLVHCVRIDKDFSIIRGPCCRLCPNHQCMSMKH